MQRMTIYGVSFDMVGKQPIVLLKTVDGNKFLPIWIGHPEAAAILMKLQGASTPRPMTHDLLSDVLDQMEAKCEKVSVTELRDNTFFASITISMNGSEMEIDSRPSDALALAVRTSAPIFAADDVIEESAIEFEGEEVEDTGAGRREVQGLPRQRHARGLRPGRGALAGPPQVGPAVRPAWQASLAAAVPWRGQDPRDQLGEVDPAASAAIGKRLVSVRPGDRVHLEDLGAVLAQHQVDPREAGAAERLVGPGRELLDEARLLVGQLGRADVLGAADLVAGLEVEEVLLARNRLDHRQGLIGEDADGQLPALHVALEQDPVVVAEGRDQRLRDLVAGRRELDPERGALARGLDRRAGSRAAPRSPPACRRRRAPGRRSR